MNISILDTDGLTPDKTTIYTGEDIRRQLEKHSVGRRAVFKHMKLAADNPDLLPYLKLVVDEYRLLSDNRTIASMIDTRTDTLFDFKANGINF